MTPDLIHSSGVIFTGTAANPDEDSLESALMTDFQAQADPPTNGADLTWLPNHLKELLR